MFDSNCIKLLLIQAGAQRKRKLICHVVKNSADNATSDACTTNQTMTFVRSKYLEIA